jgi:Uma2 family endonuclease
MDSAIANKSDNPLALLKPKKKPRFYSLEEYLKREERALEQHEYFNGTIIAKPMAKGPHNIIVMNTGTALNNAIDEGNKSYTVLGSNQKVYLPTLNYGLYPDVLVVCEEPEYWDENELLLINPLLIVEVLSKSTRSYDRGNKLREYKTLASFKEYMLIEQDKHQVEISFREEQNLWRDTVITDPNGMVELKSIGCSISMAQVYKKVFRESKSK